MVEPLRRRVRASLLGGLTVAAGRLPAPVVRGALATLAGAARFSRYERLTRDNLELVLGAGTRPEARERIARGVRRHSARLAQEWARLAFGATSEAKRERMVRWVDEMVEFDESIARLDELYAAGRGVLVATAHIGNWELLAAALRRRGHEGAVIGFKKQRDSSSEWWIGMRRAYGVETLPQEASPRRVLEVLRSGRTLGILCDLEARRIASEVVPFFGLPASTMTAPASLARASALPVVPVRCIARGERYLLSVDEPLHLERGLARRAGTIELLRRLNQVFERWIRETPEQWAWHQRRWRVIESDPASVPSRRT